MMQIERLAIEGILVVVPNKRSDLRGFFSETYRSDVLAAEGVRTNFVQDNHVYSAERRVLRGLHFQVPPRAQGKLVRCTRGAILDVVVDVRKDSPTWAQHAAIELTAANWKQLWVPPGFAHGYVTLEPNCEVIYKVTDYWATDCERGVVWNDPDLGIDWRFAESELILTDRDRGYPPLRETDPVFHFDKGPDLCAFS
jgi:dTDP-4-dehydrorhamnose 3,5-epimerase